MGFQKILEKYRKIAFSERDKGDRFERLMQAYLLSDPRYGFFKQVWLWDEFPGKIDLGSLDSGIDLVALTHQGEYWAIQCKCYQEDTLIDKPAVDTFLSTSSRSFHNERQEPVQFAYRLWISTTNRWGPNATEAIRNQHPPVTRLNLSDLVEAPVDWEKLDQGIHGVASRTAKKSLRPHQLEALHKAQDHFKHANRGKLIMACGTGKTFTSLRIAENQTEGNGLILFLVPSIALLGQSLREWYADAQEPINAVCICSDPEISRKRSKNDDNDTFSVVDLAMPASTNTEYILHQFHQIQESGATGMTVVFSTYQSIQVIAQAQKTLLTAGFNEFDLIICDEAHRTTGVTLAHQDESDFTRVHDNNFIKAKKRLYMTATPRLYSDDVKSKAAQAEAILCSMDDPALYGEEIYRIGFGEAVERDLLTDYKVLILTLNDRDVPPAVQHMLSDSDTEIKTDDLSKLIGTVNALSKQFLGDQGITKELDPEPMRRAVAFCQSITVSKKISETYNNATQAYIGSLPEGKQDQMVSVKARHIDGSMNAPFRDEMLTWLKEPFSGNECRILTNVRVLSEGVDVPSLDAVLFLSARNSQVDVVQSVGRVMRKAPGKKYGYIVIPVLVPSDVEPEKALDDNERYKVVWTVLNALRAHDDRFNATVNKIELNRKKPDNILVGRPEYTFDEEGNPWTIEEDLPAYGATQDLVRQIALQFEQLQQVVFARMVLKVGDRRYWEQWARDVALIAGRQIERIAYLIAHKKDQREAFEAFLTGLQKNINPGISETQAVEMLAQHLITQPIFDALFEGYSFARQNPVSTAMQAMLDVLEAGSDLAAQGETLKKFYDSVRKRAAGIDNAEARQRIIIELYDKFFQAAFPKMKEQLGIVYTPVEVVDFIIHSVEDVLQKEFGRSISDENVHILDPFTGTGTFMTRLLQSGLIDKADLARKYSQELHANEIVLLAYYIAAVNIENAYHDLSKDQDTYLPFEGIVLTDTFQLTETKDDTKLFSETFQQNSERVRRQMKAPLRVIMGNPPYSVGQKSANDNAQNQKYNILDKRIADTYANKTDATNKNSLYDSYIKAFRWSTDRLDPVHGGIIAFVSNGAWLDGNSADGFRKTLEEEFSTIWVFNLRGNQRTSGELSRKEGGKIFGSGSRTPIAITLLVKKPQPGNSGSKALIYYRDIGEYLSREDKLNRIKGYRSIGNPDLPWRRLLPNKHGDWIGKRNDVFETFIPLAQKENENTFWNNGIYCRGVETARDSWVYQSNKILLKNQLESSITYYKSELDRFKKAKAETSRVIAKEYIKYDNKKISWSRAFIYDLENYRQKSFNLEKLVIAIYRPFFKQYFYFSREQNNVVSRMDSFFPNPSLKNLVICVSGVGGNKDFSAIITDAIPDVQLQFNSQAFPLYYYEVAEKIPTLFSKGSVTGESEYLRKDAISDFILEQAKKQYGISAGAGNISKEDLFYYVYGFLHSPAYRLAFANDLRKTLPRIPLVEDVRDFWKFSRAGRQLAELHVDYERVPPYPDVVVQGEESAYYRVEKMRFPQKGQKDTILYNSRITLSQIPAKAYEYIVNGKSAIEWVMERYQPTLDAESGIRNDPNDWAEASGNPRYILDLLLSVIHVSVQTVDIVNSLPNLHFEQSPQEEADIREHELVLTTEALGEFPTGTIGTVVHVYEQGRGFEVEFVRVDGTGAVETAFRHQIEKKYIDEIAQ